MPEFGICIWNVVPVRTNPSDKEELCTQLLFGDTYEIVDETEDKKWKKINIAYDGYQGWIDTKQHYEIDQDFFESNSRKMSLMALSLGSTAVFAEKEVPLVPGSSLPFFDKNHFLVGEHNWGFSGKAGVLTKDQLIAKAFEYLGTPYLWGGKTPFGIDCSGFVQMVFKQCGIVLPRDAYQQAEVGSEITLHEAKAGDLAFFANEKGKMTHVGIILKDSNIIHAHGEVRVDRLDEKGIFNSDRAVYSHTHLSVRAIF